MPFYKPPVRVLRPVLMTTAAMILGVVPLILATGAGAVSRFDIGLTIASGMFIGTMFTLLVVPAMYILRVRSILTVLLSAALIDFCVVYNILLDLVMMIVAEQQVQELIPWPYVIRRSAKVKSLRISVSREYGVEVVYPRWSSRKVALQFLLESRSWLNQHQKNSSAVFKF